MNIWAISDLHLSFGLPDKKMDLFGENWKDHTTTIEAHWDSHIKSNDIVLIPGDISWAIKLEDALPDLQWIHERPGQKVIIKGNHDYWWSSVKKIKEYLPSSIQIIQNNCVCFDTIAIGGSRLWDSPEYSFNEIINFTTPLKEKKVSSFNAEALFKKELARLEMSLQSMPKEATLKIALTHFPPIGLDLQPSLASQLFEKYGISLVVFGHLHSIKREITNIFGKKRGVQYVCSSCDYIKFYPIKLLSMSE